MNLNKCPISLVDMGFVKAVAWAFRRGLMSGMPGEIRKIDGWKDLFWSPGMERAYFDSLLRHVDLALNANGTTNKMRHLASVGTNACIIWWHTKNQRSKK